MYCWLRKTQHDLVFEIVSQVKFDIDYLSPYELHKLTKRNFLMPSSTHFHDSLKFELFMSQAFQASCRPTLQDLTSCHNSFPPLVAYFLFRLELSRSRLLLDRRSSELEPNYPRIKKLQMTRVSSSKLKSQNLNGT